VFHDDSQVVHTDAREVYGVPQTVVTVEILTATVGARRKEVASA
jgi:hypothetical protein